MDRKASGNHITSLLARQEAESTAVFFSFFLLISNLPCMKNGKKEKRVTKNKVEANAYRSAGKKKKSIALGRPMVALDVSYSYKNMYTHEKNRHRT